MVLRSQGDGVMEKQFSKLELLDLYNDLGKVRAMMVERRAPQSLVARVTDARLAVSWLVDNRD